MRILLFPQVNAIFLAEYPFDWARRGHILGTVTDNGTPQTVSWPGAFSGAVVGGFAA